jgi:hypothetical protein
MHVVKRETKEGNYDHVSVDCRIGDFGISVFHRPGRHYRSEAPSLKQPKIAGESVSELFIFNRVDSDRNAIQGLPNTNAVALHANCRVLD